MPRPSPQVVLGRNVAYLRTERHLTQEDLADRAGVHPVLVSRVETGRTDVRLSTLVKVAKGLRVTPSDLLVGIGTIRR